MDKLESSVCADWTTLKCAMQKLREVRDLIDGIKMNGVDKSTKKTCILMFTRNESSFIDSINVIAKEIAISLEYARKRHMIRAQRKLCAEGAIGIEEYWKNADDIRKIMDSHIRGIYRDQTIDDVCIRMFPEIADLPF